MRRGRPGRTLFAAAWLAAIWLGIWGGQPALAQEDIIDSVTGTGTQTFQYLNNTYTVNATSYVVNPLTGNTTFTGTISVGGNTYNVTALETEPTGTSALETINGTINGQSFTCTFDENTGKLVSGDCGLLFGNLTSASTPQAAAQSATSATQGAVRSQSFAVTTIISDRIRTLTREVARGSSPRPGGAMPARFGGLSAGSADTRWGVWGDASGAFLSNNSPIGYSGHSVVALTGVDYNSGQDWVIGFNAGYTNADLSLRSVTGTKESNGGVFGPYVSYIINPSATVDWQLQYTPLSNSLKAAAAGLRARYNSDRLTAAVNLNGFYDPAPFKLTGFTGYAYSWEGTSSTSVNNIPGLATNTRYGVWKLGGEAGYVLDQLELYVPVTFLFETTTPRDGTSRAAVIFGAGLRYQLGDNLRAGLQVTDTEIKSHTQDIRIGANLRLTF